MRTAQGRCTDCAYGFAGDQCIDHAGACNGGGEVDSACDCTCDAARCTGDYCIILFYVAPARAPNTGLDRKPCDTRSNDRPDLDIDIADAGTEHLAAHSLAIGAGQPTTPRQRIDSSRLAKAVRCKGVVETRFLFLARASAGER